MKKIIKSITALILVAYLLLMPISVVQAVDPSVITYENSYGITAKTSDGVYFYGVSFLRYFDYASESIVIVCGKADCLHDTDDPNVPLADRCHAYLDASSRHGGVINNKLYITENNRVENYIFESNLDRSNTKLLTTLPTGYFNSLAVYDDHLILPFAERDYAYPDRSVGGDLVVGETTQCYLLSINPETGETTRISDVLEGFSGELGILTTRENTIYLAHYYYTVSRDDERFGADYLRQDFYAFDVEQHMLEPLDLGLEDGDRLITLVFIDGDAYFFFADESERFATRESWRGNLARKSLDREQYELITDDLLEFVVLGDLFYYRLGDDPKVHYASYPRTGEKIIIPVTSELETYILDRVGGYIYLLYFEDSDNPYYAFLRMEDFLSGNWENVVARLFASSES